MFFLCSDGREPQRDADEDARRAGRARPRARPRPAAAALCAETPDEKVRFTEAFHKAGRGLRQSLALHARLERELVRAAREDASHARAETERRIVRRKAEVTAHIQPLIWSEHEPPEADHLAFDLAEALEAESYDEAFLAEPVETQIARLCDALGVAVQDPPPQGEVAQGAGGGFIHGGTARGLQPPQSLRDSSPSGGASENPDFNPSG